MSALKKESEKDTEPWLVSQVKKLGGLCIKLYANTATGLPDRLVLLPGGVVFFVELKSEGKAPRKIQLFVHRKIQSLGFMVYVASTKAEVNNIIQTQECNTPRTTTKA